MGLNEARLEQTEWSANWSNQIVKPVW